MRRFFHQTGTCVSDERQWREAQDVHTIQVVSRHEQFKTELRRNVQVGDTGRVTVLLVVVEVLAHLLQHHAVDVLKRALMRL